MDDGWKEKRHFNIMIKVIETFPQLLFFNNNKKKK